MVKATLPHFDQDDARASAPLRELGSAAAPSARAEDEPQGSGASPSNTAPANYTQDPLILRTGIDSLYVSYAGGLREDLEPTLEACKMLAQSSDAVDQKEATLTLSSQPFAVLGKGKGYFPYVLTNNWFHVQVSRARSLKLPLAYVQIRSEVLTCAPLRDVIGALNLVAEVLGGKVVHPSVSRVDLCVDFVTGTELESIHPTQWVSRAQQRASYYQNQRFSGLVFGQGGPVSCRLYDKTLEIEKSKKTYLYPLWEAQGWDGQAPVWRLEFQLKAEALREFNVRTVTDLTTQINGLWQYCTTQWLRLCIPEGSNASRWPVHALWQALSDATFNDQPVGELRRIRKDTAPSDDRLFIHGLGGLTSFMARDGIATLEEAMPLYLEAAHDFHRRYSQYNGKTLATYVREKVQQKRTKYSARQQREYDRKTRCLKEDV